MSEESSMPKKKASPQVWKFYEIEEKGLKRLKKECPRCGRGVFLAEHKDRYTCGKCNYTQFKK